MLMNSNYPIQRLSVIRNLPFLLRNYREKTMESLLPSLLAFSNKKSDFEFQVYCGAELATLIRQDFFTTEEVSDQILPKTLNYLILTNASLSSSSSPSLTSSSPYMTAKHTLEVNNAWLDTLLAMIPKVDRETLTGVVCEAMQMNWY
jgi:hypothetical protein